MVLVFHVTDRDLLDDRAVRRRPLTEARPVLVGRLRSWLLTAGKVTIKPVVDLDPAAHPPVDQHDPPARMAAAVRFRDTTCVYPRCGRPSEACDLDHIDPYVPLDEGGPPGQTSLGEPRARCAAGTTAPRPSATSPTDDSTTGPTSGPSPPASGSPPTHAPRDRTPTAAAPPTNLTAPQPDTHPVIGLQARPDPATARHVMCCDRE